MDKLLKWAAELGVELNGIKAQNFPGRGIGVVATRRIEKDETIITVPTTAIQTLDTIPLETLQSLPPDTPLHGILALHMTLTRATTFRHWQTVFPRPKDLATSTLPFFWPAGLQTLLPGGSTTILRAQQAKYAREWAVVAAAAAEADAGAGAADAATRFPGMGVDEADFCAAWFTINTRSFYYATAALEAYDPVDRLALLPVADLFNHADGGCGVSFNETRYVVAADRVYEAGEEVFTSYGAHSNDFLMVEYGFVLSGNRWDCVVVDEVVLPLLSAAQKGELQEHNYLGNYIIDPETLGCHRTQVALRMVVCSLKQWRLFVAGRDDGEKSQKKVDKLLLKLVTQYLKIVENTIDEIDQIDSGEQCQRELLSQRWDQIREMLIEATSQLTNQIK